MEIRPHGFFKLDGIILSVSRPVPEHKTIWNTLFTSQQCSPEALLFPPLNKHFSLFFFSPNNIVSKGYYRQLLKIMGKKEVYFHK